MSKTLFLFCTCVLVQKSVADSSWSASKIEVDLDVSGSSSSAKGGCPIWGPIDGFQEEGLQKGRYLGRWYRQKSLASWSDLGSHCYSKFYSRKFLDDPGELVVTSDSVSTM